MYNNLYYHVVKLLNAGKRMDGRGLLDYRKPIDIEQDIIKTAEGSARVKIGKTEVIVGVKLEVGTPYPDTPDEGTIIVGAELLPLSNPEFELGPPGIQAVELARVVDRGIRESKAIDFKKLCIEEGNKVWLVVIDICTINDDGNLLDASSLAALAALKTVKFPKYDEKAEKVNYKEKTSKKLEVEKEPIAITVTKIGGKLIVDPTTEEEKVLDARLTVITEKDGTLCALQKGGDAPLTSDEVMQIVDIAAEKGKELRGAL